MQIFVFILSFVLAFASANEVLEISVGPDIPVYISTKTCQIRLKSGQSFDYEKQASYFFAVKALSETSLLRNTEVKNVYVSVRVIDVNDEPPVFVPFFPNYPQAFARAVLAGESKTPPGTRVFHAQATDADATSLLEYSWTPGLESSSTQRFYISPSSGVITTVGDEAFPVNYVYQLSIRVVDRNAAVPETSFADMLLFVYTAFQPVQFPMPIFQVNVSEELPPETEVGYIPARYLNDLTEQITFNVLRQPEASEEPVRIENGGNGLILVKRRYDYEQILDHSWGYFIEASVSKGYSATALMVINLVDVDDNPPFFELAEYQTELILETVQIGTAVLEVTPGDRDTDPANRVYQYELSGTDASKFHVEATATSGARIITAAQLDYDSLPVGRPFYEFELIASDKTSSDRTTIRVMIQNANVNPPVIVPLPRMRIYRQQVNSSYPFAQVAATDRDGGSVNFHFVDPVTSRPVSEFGPFRIGVQTGNISLIAEPALVNYTLPVRATDLGVCPGCPSQGTSLESETVSIEVEVVDKNLVAPTFTECPAILRLKELAEAGTVIGVITATDSDDPDLAALRLRYELIGNTVFARPNQYLTIDSTSGSITNAQPLLRSADQFGGVLPDQLYFTVAVYDWGVPELKSLCNFRLEIEDINNYPPQFDPESYTAFVQRNVDFGRYPTSPILQVVAVDLDQEGTDNAQIIYEFDSNVSGPFSINQSTGEISATGTVLNEQYSFNVIAKNKVQLEGTSNTWKTAYVHIIAFSDLQLLPPVISVSHKAEKFMENRSNLAVAEFSASPFPGASYDYSIAHIPGAFEQTGWVNSPPPFTSEITYNTEGRPTLTLYSGSNFLYQRLNQYVVRIRACQQPTHAVWGDICADVVNTFRLEDVNDMVPQFIDQSSLSEVGLLENAPHGTAVLKLFAVDMDPSSEFNQVNYALVQTTDMVYFRIDGHQLVTGSLALDYEKKKNYVLKVKVEDSAPSSLAANQGRPNSGELPLTIHLLDQNDEPPQISSESLEFNVAETTEVGAEIGGIIATDADETSVLVYTLTGSNHEFAINSATGSIIVARPLGLATVRNQQYTVSVNDGDSEATAVVRINILPSNDRLPEFTQTLYTQTATELSVMTLDLSISASDPNEPAQLTYTLGGHYQSFFSIDSQAGTLSIIKGIPRDLPDGYPSCSVSVMANNQKGVAYAQVLIQLQDINNQQPRWPFPNQTVACPENSVIGRTCATLSAPDADAGENAISTYEAVTANPNFQITQAGSLIPLTTFDFETATERMYFIPIVATNERPPAAGGKSFSVSGTLTVFITDSNDSPPMIVGGPNFNVTVPETAKVGVDFFAIFIEDVDIADFGKHSCALSSSNAYFEVVYNPSIDACGIRPLQRFDVDDEPSTPPGPQDLTINIFDSSYLVSSNVRITVVDINDNAPYIQVQPYTGPGEVLDQTIGVLTLATLQATSVDSSDNGFRFHLDSKSSAVGMFGIDTISSNTNSETSPVPSPTLPSTQNGRIQWPLIISVSDNQEPSLTSTTTLTLTVITKGPTIPDSELNGYHVFDKSEAGTTILPQNIEAKDLDYPSQTDNIVYDISSYSALALRLFEIANATAGKFSLKLRSTISRETEGTSCFPVPIVASIPSLARTATSTLTVTVSSDNPPAPSDEEGSLDVFIPSDTWPWPYTNALPNLPIATMPVTEVYACDRVNRIFEFIPQNENNLLFTVTEDGVLNLLTASPPGEFAVKATVSTRYNPTLKNATSSLKVNINWLPSSGFTNGIIVRVQKTTLEWFIERSKSSSSTPRQHLISAIARQLGVSENSIAVFPTQQVGEDLNIFVGIHSSPYEVPGRIIDSILNEADIYNAALRASSTNTQVTLAATVRGMSGAVVLQCGSEAAAVSVCNNRGCRSRLTTVDIPNETNTYAGLTKPTPGSSTSAAILRTFPDCWCNGGDPLPPTEQPITCLSPDACLNGGFCRLESGTQTTTCECPSGFSGGRCEQTQIYFTKAGYAWSPSLGSCTQLHIRFQLRIPSLNGRPGLILYAGPINQSSTNVVMQDFIGLQIESGGRRLTLAYCLGSTGIMSATFTVTFRLDDSSWHQIDLVLMQKLIKGTERLLLDFMISDWLTSGQSTNAEVTLMVDNCGKSEGALQVNGLENPPALADCLFTLPHSSGLDRALNVDQWPLQLGGRKPPKSASTYPTELTTNSLPTGSAFRHVLVNGELWNLAQFGPSQNAAPAPSVCLNRNGQDVCAPNGICWEVNGQASCECKPGFKAEKGSCAASTFSVELGPSPSYLELTTKSQWLSQVQTDVTFDFRTRSANGTLVYLGGPDPNFYANSSTDIRLKNTRLEVAVNLGNFDTLLVSPARSNLSDGAWHHVRVFRSLSSVFVEIDDAAGPGLTAFLPLNSNSNYLKMSIGNKILIGARRDFVPGIPVLGDGEVRPAGSSIGETCFRDLRINEAWIPLTKAEISAAGESGQVASINGYGSNRDTCSGLVACPSNPNCPGELKCIPTWKPPGGYMCLCQPDCVEGPENKCYCLAICSRFPCLNGGTCQPSAIDKRGFVCHCPSTHFGLYCEEEVMVANLTVGAFIGIVLSIVCFIFLIIAVVIWRCYRKRAPPQISPDMDLREHVMPYTEQADEIDTHSFDERKLGLPELPLPRFPVKTQPISENGEITRSTASPIYASDVTSFSRVLRDQLKTNKNNEVPDYTLDYGYEGENSSLEEDDADTSGISSPIQTSSGFNEGGGETEPFGDTFDALNRLSDGGDFSGSQRR
ncbi:hypothetical protein Aperf_G00000082111 [Anoplocephala perfoliata]